jgi:hypothetical protein
MRCLFFFLLLSMAGSVLAGDDVARLQAINRQMRAEMELAKKSQLYVVFNLPQRQVQLKSSGLSVSTLTVKNLIHWGGVPDEKLRQLASKDAPQAPQREKIQPTPAEGGEQAKTVTPPATPTAEEGQKKFELQALEIDDMPGRYNLRFDDGLLITVRAEEDGAVGGFQAFFARCWWYLSRPLISLWSYFFGTPYTEIILTMSLRDARQLYWSFTPGTSCLILRNAADD